VHSYSRERVQKMAWSVVHFFNDNTVEVVPDFWFNKYNNKCAWPMDNSAKNIERREKPTSKNFLFLKARMFPGCEKIGKNFF
jgi:hypothetical protein